MKVCAGWQTISETRKLGGHETRWAAGVEAGHAVPGGDADREPGGHYVTGVADAAGMSSGGGGRYAADRAAAEAFRYFETAHQLFPVQRSPAQRRNPGSAAARRDRR